MNNFSWKARGWVFLAVLFLCLTWAWITGHVWEDFWITFRSSKNLIQGHGLVFNVGDKLHTFTSPLGVLLPAAASAVTGGNNDTAAIWVFRVLNSAAFAGAVLFLMALALRGNWSRVGVVLAAGMTALDAKSIDFTTNGMETGLLLCFISYTLWALYGVRTRKWAHLGLAWAGLMWTRPDSFLYIGFLAAGAWLFNDQRESGLTRRQWFAEFLRAGMLCTALYLPWFVWAWWYYGSPIPHTIVAKGAVTGPRSIWGALRSMIDLPKATWLGTSSLEGAFLPSYYQLGGWPSWLQWVARILAMVVAVQWLFPWRGVVRTASLAFLGMHVYLSYYPFFPFPWYLPGTAFLAAVVIGGAVSQIIEKTNPSPSLRLGWRRSVVMATSSAAAILLAIQVWTTWQMMRQMRVEQELSGNAIRRRTGEWLRANAKPTDTVLMEPLGYIGYFSGLKTYDLPGLSSRESVRALKAVKLGGVYVIDYLAPDWIVLRPWEAARHNAEGWQILNVRYNFVTEFDTTGELEKVDVYGKGYIQHDAHWKIYRRVEPAAYRLDVTNPQTIAKYPLQYKDFDGHFTRMLHAAGAMSFAVPDSAREFEIHYGLPSSSYTGAVATDGVGFHAWFVGEHDEVVQILDQRLEPATRSGDRGEKRLTYSLPPGRNREIVLACSPGPNNGMDWSCWSIPTFK